MGWRGYGEGSLARSIPYRRLTTAQRRKLDEIREAKRERMRELLGTKPIMTPADDWLRLDTEFEKGDRHHLVFNEDPETWESYDEAVGPRDPHADNRVYDWIEDPGIARVENEVCCYIDYDLLTECRRKEGERIRAEAAAERQDRSEAAPESEWQPPPEVRKKERSVEEQRAQRRRNRKAEQAFERARDEAVSARQRLAAAEAARKKAEEEMWQKLTREEWSRRRAERRALADA